MEGFLLNECLRLSKQQEFLVKKSVQISSLSMKALELRHD